MNIDQNDFDMVVLAILTVADCSAYTLERLVRQTLHIEDAMGASVYCTVRGLMEKGFASSYQSPGIGSQMYTSTKEGRAYFKMMADHDERYNGSLRQIIS